MKQVKINRHSIVIDLSGAGELTKRAIRDWVEAGHSLDKELLIQCAYYPKGGCEGCSFQHPKKECSRSHILKLEPATILRPRGQSQPSKPKEVTTILGFSLQEISSRLSPFDKQKLMDVLKGC